jgi:hypothetical protein
VRVNGTLIEDKMRRFKGECEHFRFNKCPIYTHDGAGAIFSTNSQEMDNSASSFAQFSIHFAGFFPHKLVVAPVNIVKRLKIGLCSSCDDVH